MRYMTLSNVCNSYITSFTVQHIKIPVTIKLHALVANGMLVSKNMDTLVFTPKYFYCFEGNVANMLLHVNAPISKGPKIYY